MRVAAAPGKHILDYAGLVRVQRKRRDEELESASEFVYELLCALVPLSRMTVPEAVCLRSAR